MAALGLAVVGLVVVAGAQGAAAARHATRAKAALLAAERLVEAGEVEAATGELEGALGGFRSAEASIERLGPLLTVARAVPFVRVQVRGTEAFADAGILLSEAALQLTAAATTVIDPPLPDVPVAASLASLRDVDAAMVEGLAALDAAMKEIAALNGYRLVGPLATARADLVERLPEARARAARAQAGLSAFLSFAGAQGPRRYLVFSQNPDEVRPTGGFLGTYGVVVADADGIRLERYEGYEAWMKAPEHQDAKVPADEASTAFRIVEPSNQVLFNVNDGPDWPAAARLASELWVRGGEAPVDGVVSFTPDFFARMLGILGPIEVPSFGETVTEHTLIERADYHTHVAVPAAPGERKAFVAEAVKEVLEKLLDAPASSWRDLAKVATEGFDAREAMAWSREDEVAEVLAGLRWDGAFHGADGDFVAPSEFEYAAKNGRALRRSYTHRVDLRPDGSGRVETTATFRNGEEFNPGHNIDSLTYVVMYGPRGASLAEDGDEPNAVEDDLDGHPAAGWLRAAPPLGEDHLRLVWEAPALATVDRNRSMTYRLHWRHLPAHTGDEVALHVELPAGWRWQSTPPPPRIELPSEFSGSWRAVPSSSSGN